MNCILQEWFILTNTFTCITAINKAVDSTALPPSILWVVGISVAAITNYYLVKKLK